jgi:dienelactone hydrolase
LSGRFRALRQDVEDVLKHHVTRPKQHHQVIDQIRGLRRQFRIRARDAGQGGLDALFPDLLGDAFDALGEQAGGPAFGRVGGGADGDGRLQPGEAAEARARPRRRNS